VSARVGIVIVSHSADVARGTAEMVRQMAGAEVQVAWTGGNPAGGLGTDVRKIVAAVESEMAIEMLPAARREHVVICNAPLVEGAIVGAAEAASGSDLRQVRRAAEELLRT
jgi:PTS hybrid protein